MRWPPGPSGAFLRSDPVVEPAAGLWYSESWKAMSRRVAACSQCVAGSRGTAELPDSEELDHVRHVHWGLACLLASSAIAMSAGSACAQAPTGHGSPGGDGVAAGAVEKPRARAESPAAPPATSYFIILSTPADYEALLRKIQQPDLEIRRVERPGAGPAPAAGGDAGAPDAQGAGAATTQPGGTAGAGAWVVESVRVRGRVRGDSAVLRIELAIAMGADGPAWVPIRLDDQRLIDAREGNQALAVRVAEPGTWEVELTGRGVHRIAVDLRCPLTTRPARAGLSLAIPAASSTSLDLDFDRRQQDLIVGTNEVYGQSDLPGGQGSRMSARLTPRSRIDVSWAVEAQAGAGDAPLLTAQGDIAIDVDSEQMRIWSSWVIRCVRGIARTLEIGVDERDVITEIRLDDQSIEPGNEGARGAGRLLIPLAEPLRPGDVKRLVLRTRRAYGRGPSRRIAFGGFVISNAREQSGAIGVIQSANLWVAPASSQGLRRIPPTSLPQELRERPATSLAFEFLDQPFNLDLDVEDSPPLVRSQLRTLFHLEADRVRSETTIELQWVRGRLFEVELGLGPGLEVVSVGPPDVVEAWNPTGAPSRRGAKAPAGEPRGLTIRLAPAVRDQSKVTIRLGGLQPLPRDGRVSLGLIAPDETAAVASSFTIAGDRGVSVELDDDTSRSDRPGSEAAFRAQEVVGDRGSPPSGGSASGPALVVEAVGSPRTLPIRITRHARSIGQETTVSAEVSRRRVDVLQKTRFSVRHGTLATLEVRVPKDIADGWELLDREVIDREDLAREADGSRRYRLYFDRPVLDRTTLAFRFRMPVSPVLDAEKPRELALPWIDFPEAAAGPARVEMATAPGVVLRGGDPQWNRSPSPAGAAPPAAGLATEDATAGAAYTQGDAGPRGRPFHFRAAALQAVELPALVVPRSLIETTQGFDGSLRGRAWYWVETHGPAFPFALPQGAWMIAARVNGRAADGTDLEATPAGYRLRLPAEAASRPALVELEYQLGGPAARGDWAAPRLLDGGLVLRTLWQVRLPWDRTLLGVPSGWTDENQWYWSGYLWVRRPARDVARLGEWLLGAGASPAAAAGLRDGELDESHPLLFSRTGQPEALGVRIVPRAWLVAAGSGATLALGFLAIFARLRFRTAWAVAAIAALVAAAVVQPSLAMQLIQASFLGAVLSALGLVIQHRLDRRRAPAGAPGRDTGSAGGTPPGDSSLNRGSGTAGVPSVGSDDSTAIRVRTPSTLDYHPAPLAGPSLADETRSSTLGRS